LVNREQNRTHQFIKGFRKELRKVLALFPPTSYATTMDATTRTENIDRIRLFSKTPSSTKQQWQNKGKIGKDYTNKSYSECDHLLFM
jgi:hypothetical protein